jgi:hypothetical protein
MKRNLFLMKLAVVTLMIGLAINLPAQTTYVNALGAASGWYSDDTRGATGTDLVGLTLTLYGKPGQIPTAADDILIAQQISFAAGPGNVGALKMDKTTSGGGWSKCTTSLVNEAGHATGDSWLNGFFCDYRYYTNSTAEVTVPKIGIQSTDWGTGVGQSQYGFTALRSGEQVWDLILVDWRGTNPGWAVNSWASFTTDKDTQCWRIYRQGGNGFFPATPSVSLSLQEIYNDAYWGPKIFGAGAKVVSFQFGVGSSTQTSTSYIDYVETNLLNGGNRVDFMSNLPVHNITQGTDYATIQAAVTAANAGDEIHVDAGTFNESVTTNKSLKLVGAGCGQTIWRGTTITGRSLSIVRNNTVPANIHVEITGFSFETENNQTIRGSWSVSYTQALTLDIHDNCFAHVNSRHPGIDFALYVNGANQTPRGAQGAMRVYDNLFDVVTGGVLFEYCRAVDVINNTFNVTYEAVTFNYYTNAGICGEQLVQGNVFTHIPVDWAFAMNNWHGSGTYTVLPSTVTNNLITATGFAYAILYGVEAPQTQPHNFTIYNNAILSGTIIVWGGGSGQGVLNASVNWWGSASSPAARINTAGTVDFTPWLDTGTDISGDPGFQGDFATLWVDDNSPQTGTAGRIQEGINLVSGSTVNVLPGTYNEGPQVVIGKDVTVTGADKATTIIHPTANTGTSGDARGWFLVQPGYELNLSQVTLDGTGFLIWQGIRHLGEGTIDQVDFVNIRYNESTAYQGVAVAAFGAPDMNVDISHCSFTGIGRVGVLYFGTGITNSLYSYNTYTGKGAGNWLDYGVEFGGGAKGTIDNSSFTNCYGVASDASESAGVMGTEYYGDGTEMTVTNSNVNNNLNGIFVGYDDTETTVAEIHQNVITGNTNYAVYCTQPTQWADATLNYWGDATGPHHPVNNPGGLGDEVSDYVLFDPWYTDPGMQFLNLVDIGLFETTCADFEVRLRPGMDITDAYLTNLVFTLKWPVGTVNLIDINSTFVAQQGPVQQSGGYNYAIFVGVPFFTNLNWTAGTEYVVMTFSHDESGSGTCTIEIGDDAFTAANNADYYFELLGEDLTGVIYHNAENVYLGPCDAQIKAFLNGPYNAGTGMMDNTLYTASQIPLSQPYNVPPWNYNGTESVASIPADVVDWVLVELRTGPLETELFERKAAFIMTDGSIRKYDDITRGVKFDDIIVGDSYYLVVWHRNHMPVMSGAGVALPNATVYDFTDYTTTQPYGYPSLVQIEMPLPNPTSGIYGMIAGDVNANGELKYSGAGNDRGLIIAKIVAVTGSPLLTNVITNGYWMEDVNLNNEVKYVGSANDREYIVQNLNYLTGLPYLHLLYQCLVPGAYTAKAAAGGNGMLDISMKETPATVTVSLKSNGLIETGTIDNLQFTLGWKEGDTYIEEILQGFTTAYGLIADGPAMENDGWLYQVYVSVTPVALPEMYAGDEVEVMTITKAGEPVGDRLQIMSNAFTAVNNADYYVSVWGSNFTGMIAGNLTLAGDPLESNRLRIYPNPVSQGYVTLYAEGMKGMLDVSITDLTGKVLVTESWETMNSGTIKKIDVSSLSKGVYLISIKGKDIMTNDRLVIQ